MGLGCKPVCQITAYHINTLTKRTLSELSKSTAIVSEITIWWHCVALEKLDGHSFQIFLLGFTDRNLCMIYWARENVMWADWILQTVTIGKLLLFGQNTGLKKTNPIRSKVHRRSNQMGLFAYDPNSIGCCSLTTQRLGPQLGKWQICYRTIPCLQGFSSIYHKFSIAVLSRQCTDSFRG